MDKKLTRDSVSSINHGLVFDDYTDNEIGWAALQTDWNGYYYRFQFNQGGGIQIWKSGLNNLNHWDLLTTLYNPNSYYWYGTNFNGSGISSSTLKGQRLGDAVVISGSICTTSTSAILNLPFTVTRITGTLTHDDGAVGSLEGANSNSATIKVTRVGWYMVTAVGFFI